MSEEETNTLDPVEYEIKLVHHKQRYNWDCGVSCVLMVLSSKERDFFINNFHTICKEEGFIKSTWTIDLCYLLKRFSMNFVFYTTTLGIHPQHKGQHFYEKIIYKDEERVTERFNKAKLNGITVKKKSMNTTDLLKHLRKHGPVILLTNASYLYCDRCKKNKFTNELRNCLPWVATYHGHYIVLCGYDYNRKKFFYRNPDISNRVCVMSFTALNKARLSYGTDEDCICIFSKS